MRTAASRLAAVSLLLCSACAASVSTWQASDEITPLTYRPVNPSVKRSVGKLRQLVLLPIRFERVDEDGAPGSVSAWDVEKWASLTFQILSEEKGYEILPMEFYQDILATALRVSVDAVRRYPDSLERWARDSPDGALPPEEVVTIVTRLGRVLHADGVILIQVLKRETRADIYEVATGRIVWRSRLSGSAPLLPSRAGLRIRPLESVLEPLEQAVPRVLVEE